MRKRYWLSAMALAATMAAMPALAQQSAEQQVMELANADRAQHGLAPLKWDPALAQAAAEHAQLMAQQQALSHQFAGEPDLVARGGAAGAHFRSIAENVAVAPNPEALNQEWMNSTPHRANILNPTMNGIGVGVVKVGPNYYAVEDFADSVAQIGPQQIEQKIGQLLQQRGLQPAGLTAGCPSNLRVGPGLGRRSATDVHHALGGNGFGPLARCSGREDCDREISQGRGGRMQFGQCRGRIYNLQDRGAAVLLSVGRKRNAVFLSLRAASYRAALCSKVSAPSPTLVGSICSTLLKRLK